MTKTELRGNVVGVVAVALSFALGITIYQAFLIADMDDVKSKGAGEKRRPAPKPAKPQPMKEFSGHGQAVSDNKKDSERQALIKQMVEEAPSSQMLG